MKDFLKHFNKAIEHNKDNDKKKSFKITYKKGNGRTVKRKIDPFSIRGNLVLAYDHKRDATRSFKIEGIKHMEKAAGIKEIFNTLKKRLKSNPYKHSGKIEKVTKLEKVRELVSDGSGGWVDPAKKQLRLRVGSGLNKEGANHMEKSAFWLGFEKQAGLPFKPRHLANATSHLESMQLRYADKLSKRLGHSKALDEAMEMTDVDELHKILNMHEPHIKPIAKSPASGGTGNIEMKKAASESPLYHGAELAGLGILAAPSVAHMMGHKVKEKNQHRAELAGLGVLAAPSVVSLAKRALKRGK